MATAPLVPPNWQLPDFFRRRLGSGVGRQRLMHEQGQLLIVAHLVPEVDESTRRGILLWRDESHTWRASSGDVGLQAFDKLLNAYSGRIEEYDQAESRAQTADQYLPLLEGLAPVSRSARNLYGVLQEARKAVPDATELIDLRDRAYEVSRNAELLFQDAKNSMEVAIVRRAEEQAAASNRMSVAAHRLNMMAALFFPLATLGAIFGTTLTDGWGWAQTAIPFFTFLGVGLATGIVLALFINRQPP